MRLMHSNGASPAPVSMTVRMPCRCSALSASRAPGRTLSMRSMCPQMEPPAATNTRVAPGCAGVMDAAECGTCTPLLVSHWTLPTATCVPPTTPEMPSPGTCSNAEYTDGYTSCVQQVDDCMMCRLSAVSSKLLLGKKWKKSRCNPQERRKQAQ
jgi:hypothetical protein